MKRSILFSGLVSPFPVGTNQGSLNESRSNDLSSLLQDFFHYMGKIWTLSTQDPTHFKISEVVDSYKEYRAINGNVSITEGLNLEESYFVTLIVAPIPLVCLLNREQPDTSTARMSRLRRLSSKEIVSLLHQSYGVKLNTKKGVSEQLQNWWDNKLCPRYITLVFDGETGHCIMITGIEKDSDRFVVWDPWPLRSLLCIENNIAGVAAEPVPSDEPFWTISPASLAKVMYATFVPNELLV